MLGHFVFFEAQSTVTTSDDALWNSALTLRFSKVFSPERTGVATAKDPNPTAGGASPSNIPSKNHGPTRNTSSTESSTYGQKRPTASLLPLPNVVNCELVSCSWASGIYVCNDSNEKWANPTCGTVADYAQAILNDCKSVALVNGEQLTQGELWDDDGWHVYVGHANC
ncbi:hypothetical protein PG984_016192 [Apiospora sp. TS-2023a]